MKRLLCLLAFLLSAPWAQAQVHRAAEMNTEQLRALDRQRTVVLLTGGILEQHGPLLPSGTDTLMNEWWTQQLAEAIVRRDGWQVLILPTLALGTSGANVLGGKYVFPGSYTVRPETERAVYMDLASELGDQGFRWIFVMHNHGSPLHNLMLDQAGDFFRDTYGGRMVNLAGILGRPDGEPPRRPETLKEEGAFEVHAGMSEVSRVLFIRPDLVSPAYRQAKPLAADSPADAVRIASAPDWPGYIGSPRLASAAFGAQEMRHRADEYAKLALAVLDGLDERTLPRLSKLAFGDKDIAAVEAGTARHYAETARRQQAWLQKNAAP